MEYTKSLETFNITDFITRNGSLVVLFGIVFWISLRTFKSLTSKKPPGPVGLPIVGYSPFLGKKPYKTLWDLRKKYGDIMGLYMGTQYTVVLSEYNIAKEVLSHPAALARPSNLLEHIPQPGFGSLNGEAWSEQRKFCRVATRDVEFGEGFWESLIMDEVFSFVSEIRSKKGAAFDFSHLLSASINSNILSILIGRRFHKEEEAEKINLSVEFADVTLTSTGPTKAATNIPGLRKFCEVFRIGDHNRVSQIIQAFTNFVRDEIKRHKTSTSISYTDDFINIYLNKIAELKKSGNKKHFFSEDMLEGNVNVLFLGGTDTITTSLTWLLKLMAKHKDVQKKIYAELMEALGHEGKARYKDRQNIPYTFAVLMESQRISSIVSLSSNRRVTQDIHVRGITIPKDSQITANLWGLHRDPTYWENPEEFRPERFLTDNGTKLITQPQSYFPFSVGRRNCPGDIIAWMEILYYFTEIVKNFEISAVPGQELKFDIVWGLVSRLVNQPLCFKERKENV